jgi:DNA-binding PadR family transcriptional regulator
MSKAPARGLKTSWFYILLSLAEEDRHGLAIARDVLTLSDGQLKLWPATLYGSLDELSTRGWIEELPEDHVKTQTESDRKRFYRLTRPGRSALTAETDRLTQLARIAKARLRPRTGGPA